MPGKPRFNFPGVPHQVIKVESGEWLTLNAGLFFIHIFFGE